MFPKHWQIKPANEICNAIVDCVNKTAPIVDNDTEFKMIRTTNVKNGQIIIDGMRCVEEEVFLKWNRRLTPKKGDVVLTREAPLGDVGLIRTNHKFFLGQRTMIYRADGINLNQRFLYYSLLGGPIQGQLKALGSGSTVEHIRVPDAEKISIPFPPISEQKKIAAILSSYDDLIENNKKRIQILENMAEELYKEWFVRFRFPNYENTEFEKGLPSTWERRQLKCLCDEVKQSVKKEDLNAEVKYIGLEHLSRKDIAIYDYSTADTVDSDKLKFKQMDILFSKIRPYLHKVCLAHFEGVCSSDTIILRAKDPIYLPYLLFTVFSETFVDLADVSSNGTKMPRANWKFLQKVVLSIPPNNLMEKYHKICMPMFIEIENLLNQIDILTQQKDSLLPRLISGKLSVENLDIQFPPSMQEQ